MNLTDKISKNEINKILTVEFGVNADYVEDLLTQFEQNPSSLGDEWQIYFSELFNKNQISIPPSSNSISLQQSQEKVSTTTIHSISNSSGTATIRAVQTGITSIQTSEQTQLRGPALKIVENMEASLTIPTATSQREVAIKLLEENRILINQYLKRTNRKISYTHIIAYSVLKGLEKFPNLNNFYEHTEEGSYKVSPSKVNLGIAVNVTRKDGTVSLLVPNIKAANKMNFSELITNYDDVVKRARNGKLQISDFQETTLTLTNPGTIGTTASNPRLMSKQGTIIATGSIDYPPGCSAMIPETLAYIGISKIMTLTSTYDHRIIQGAESGMFLAFLDEMLRGKYNFYDRIFAEIEIPYKPYRWAVDHNPAILGAGRHQEEIRKQASVLELINAYRVRGHLMADTNPLNSNKIIEQPELNIETYGLTIWDLDRNFITGGLAGLESASLRQILEYLHSFYCEKTGIEYRHIQHPHEKEWIRSRVEIPQPKIENEIKKQILWKLISAEQFEKFLSIKYLGQKRFSVEGAESVVALLDQLIEGAANRNIEDVIIGMSHRGRLNIIANVIGKFCERIFTIFEGSVHPNFPQDQYDVKYHQGASGVRKFENGKTIGLSVLPNPSHLEFINPVVEGVVRAKQDLLVSKPNENNSIQSKLAVLLHGDAAFAGEGIVAETLNLSQLYGYSTGGTIHIIVNNQVGFTTPPDEGRSSTYSTDVAKMIQAPIFHVNADDPEAVYNVLQIALDYRQKFGKDIVLDIIGFRRHGHNEGDEPTYTQPVMYRFIREHPGVRELYARKLIAQEVLSEQEIKSLIEDRVSRYENAWSGAKAIVSQENSHPKLSSPIEEPEPTTGLDTSVDKQVLNKIAQTITEVPRTFNLNPKVVGLLAKRAKMVKEETGIDWSMAEALAFGSLLVEGTSIRIAGQDTIRGTFSQRHAMFYDTQTGEPWTPLPQLSNNSAKFYIYDSPLSEAGALGFEYGYSVAAPETLILWEAQFGDFANAAQVIFDQFLSSAEEKWNQTSRLVLLLPHGYEGQGPEHSSARVERYLQLCANGNLQIVNCTTAAQYFHLLRRQIKQKISKPLIVMTPKSLLRSTEATSSLDKFTSGEFLPVLNDNATINQNEIERILLCSGKIYYDLNSKRKELNDQKTVVLRVEQLYPFPKNLLSHYLGTKLFAKATDIRWVQEEPANMGAWSYMEPRLRQILRSNQSLRYIGLSPSGSTATGSHVIHHLEQQKFLEEAFSNLSSEK